MQKPITHSEKKIILNRKLVCNPMPAGDFLHKLSYDHVLLSNKLAATVTLLSASLLL